LEEPTRVLETSRLKIEVVLDDPVTLTSTILDPAVRLTVTADQNEEITLD
jgi:hypothetical protein